MQARFCVLCTPRPTKLGLLSNLLKKQDERIVPQMLTESYAELHTNGLVDAFESEFVDLVYDCKMRGIYPNAI